MAREPAPVVLPPLPWTHASPGPLLVGPITFFSRSCADCHGEYGAFLAFEADPTVVHDPDALRRVTREMVFGQARAQLADREVDALAAYRRSLLDGRPFLAWTRSSMGHLRGEVTPGAAVEVVTSLGTVAAAVAGHTWSADLAPGQTPLAVHASLRGRDSVLPLAGDPFTHGEAQAPPSTENPAPP